MKGFVVKKKTKKRKVYGLVVPEGKKPSLAAFGDDDEPREDTVQVQKMSNQTRKDLLIQKEHDKILKENPHAYDYDQVYDTIEKDKKNRMSKLSQQREADKQQSKYIGTLVTQAKIRERENDRIRERILLKERSEEDKLFGDKDKFITSAYKQKLKENEQWELEDKRLAKIEAEQDVTKNANAMAGFYRNLLDGNLAMGSDVKATSKYTVVASKEGGKQEELESSNGQSAETNWEEEVSNVQDTVDVQDGVQEQQETIKKGQEEMVQKVQISETKEDKVAAAKARYLERKKNMKLKI